MIDSHCHIYLDTFSDDIQIVLDRAQSAGVTDIMMPSINFGSLTEMSRIDHPAIRFHKMAGIHPCEIRAGKNVSEKSILEAALPDDIVAVGETGLDYYWSTEFVKEQQESLRLHCRVAKTVNKPVVLHNRESTADLLDIIGQEQDGSLAGVWHCFNGTLDEGLRAIDLGLYLGIGGVITFKNSGVDRTVTGLPLNRLLLETDAPYLAPVPFRGKRNEPSYVKLVAEKLARTLNISMDDIRKSTSLNAVRLFRLAGS